MKTSNINYSIEENVQILISLLKRRGIKNVIVSPGSTNICFVASIQSDKYFKVYSCVDERSAAYMACGLAVELQEPVVISCTGATASRNYMPALTEAFYRQIPILAITSCQPRERVGQYIPQVLDKSSVPNDLVKRSYYIESVSNDEKRWNAIDKINSALIELYRNGGGPVHLDLETKYSDDFTIDKLPTVRLIEQYSYEDPFPTLENKKIAIFVGSHTKWTNELICIVDNFCCKYGAVVLCDQTSNYWGRYRILPNILCSQNNYSSECLKMDVLIHIGQMSGAYMKLYPKEVWRVNLDGELRDTFKVLTKVFQVSENYFFNKYIDDYVGVSNQNLYYDWWESELKKTYEQLDEIPFSNVWIANYSSKMIPQKSSIHFGILNSLRSWNFFEMTKGTLGYCNTGGFGIDGCVSSLIGASFANPNKLYFGIVGDLAFFYDLNSIGNRHIGNNVRIMIINNGKGNEFRNYGNWGSPLGEFADDYICAAKHYGNKSGTLIKNIATDLGFDYLEADNKNEYIINSQIFWNQNLHSKPIIFEVFTETDKESKALEIVYNLYKTPKSVAKDMAKNFLGEKKYRKIKKTLKNK